MHTGLWETVSNIQCYFFLFVEGQQYVLSGFCCVCRFECVTPHPPPSSVFCYSLCLLVQQREKAKG